ncbi:putative signal transducing protein [Carboxylicivirga sp. M1479]|uniref:putative signal transducing protein n=1 Tax=Carboxylicivirga sp. M1479 TaxID=2594476 RepID=UPI0011777E39|nr:DUF2007 domain-containing protein [Carboxylicivirga sp. M1479]TRX72488.1 DUF2007 domain-containing protein [Carboxylicivirga sp. M1479]
MNNRDKETTVEVYSGTLWEAEMVRSLIETAQIPNFMKNTILNHSMYDPIQSEGAKVIVLAKDEYEARIIVKNYINNLKT